DQGKSFSETVEELKYRRSLKIALDILNQNDSSRQVPPSEESPSTQLSQKNSTRSLSCTPLTTQDAKAHEDKTKPLEYRTSDLGNMSDLESVNCKRTESKPQRKQKTVKPRQLPKSQTKSKSSLKPKEEKSKQESKRPKGAGSSISHVNDLLKDQVHSPTEKRNPVPVSCESSTTVSVRRRANTKGQPRRTALGSCECAQDDLESRISNESENLAKKLDGRKKPVNLKRKKQEINASPSSCRKSKSRNVPESSPGPSNHGNLSDSLLPKLTEEENKNTSHILKNKVKDFQLPDFEEDEGLESSDMSSKVGSPENLCLLSTLVDEEEEEDEELPSILSHQVIEPQSIEEGILVWCKLRRYPYWPAVVKTLKRKHRKANVLLIEGNTNDKTKG
ncbi:PREDICTED: PWWP domain-containing protein MUM1L1-like, partial [Tinamus guttatus]|uniref:PWWP domain-containing protein MUM1L1-like n=1 Tax=Tinamus guttatus TaxID=94827 RepID=UPI00052F41BF